MELIYLFSTQVYYSLIRLVAFFNKKAKQAIAGRKTLIIPPNLKGCIWMHCSSLGEFEQGRPLIEKIKKEAPEKKILLSFFSPSGFEIRKNYKYADFVCYLPFDSPKNAQQFLDNAQPSLAIFVKYEFWHFYLKGLKSRNIPTVLISAVFRKNQIFFKKYGSFFRKMLDCFTQIFVQDETSRRLILPIVQSDIPIIIAGDTRVDRVLEIASEKKPMPKIEAFCNNKKVFVVGSSWQPDEDVLLPFFNKNLPDDWKVIIAPHDIKEAHIKQIEKSFSIPTIRYSDFKTIDSNKFKALIINNIGMLSSLYRFGHMAYIGGGFGAGIHNTLEPIAHGLPVIFGSKYQKFAEAVQLVKSGGGFTINNSTQFEEVVLRLINEDQLQTASEKAKSYVKKNRGATEKIYKLIEVH